MLPAPLPNGVALHAFFLRHLCATRAAYVSTVQDSGRSPKLPPLPANTPPPGSKAQHKDPMVPFGYGPIGHPNLGFPLPSRNLAKDFEGTDQFARNDPSFCHDMMDSLQEAATMLPIVIPFYRAIGADQAS